MLIREPHSVLRNDGNVDDENAIEMVFMNIGCFNASSGNPLSMYTTIVIAVVVVVVVFSAAF